MQDRRARYAYSSVSSETGNQANHSYQEIMVIKLINYVHTHIDNMIQTDCLTVTIKSDDIKQKTAHTKT